ncbi:unnamed protein product [Cuscuta campestris]|uniref:Protein MIZU-KUSSEI 1 n=1 Tax=Cuscuta campestris TaxID=132261 RepID=A0A484LPT4_9ASTE|nr:unnamed protein product [Cuscuta campestris]
MMKLPEHPHSFTSLARASSYKQSPAAGKIIIPASNYYYYQRSTSSRVTSEEISDATLTGTPVELRRLCKAKRNDGGVVSAFLRSLLRIISFPAACWRFPAMGSVAAAPLGRVVTGTLFGHRRGHVSYAVQADSRSEPALVIELPVTTSALVREMSSGVVRIALECEKPGGNAAAARRLFHEPVWTVYFNGRKCGYAQSRACTASDWHVLGTVRSVSVGAGVIPVVEDGGELLYMRARFERVVGNRDSEAFYMMNPDGNGGAELSMFLLRI